MSASTRSRVTLSLAWIRTDEYRLLIERFGSADAACQQSAAALEAAGIAADKARLVTHPDVAELDAGMRWAESAGQTLLTIDDAGYPPLLALIKDPPLCLYVRGSVDALSLPALAIVGSRNPTAGGTANATSFARHLAGLGYTIVSGLAEGIDGAAHESTLEAGGVTIAVMGNGIDRVYPARNRDLAHRIADAGALVTEYPPGTSPRRRHFPERNRIITGLCHGTLVVEAARKSGSLISARLAAEQGREVFAIPGSIHNALARGCHRLIRDGAKLVETAADILSELAPLVAHSLDASAGDTGNCDTRGAGDAHEIDPAHETLLTAMGYDPVSVDELLHRSGLTIAELSSMLLILELEGRVEKQAGGHYARLPDA